MKTNFNKKPKLVNIDNPIKHFGDANAIKKGYKLTDIGEYSIARPKEALKITEIISNYFKNPSKKTITDATLGMAGNSIYFAKTFKKVNAFEINKLHYDVSVNNLKCAKVYNKVNAVLGSYVDLYKTVKQDIVYIDPPWGGRNYKKAKRLKLKLGNENIATFCNKLKNKTKIVVLNLPYNFDFNDLLKKTDFSKLHVYIITKNQYIGVLIN